MVHSRFSRISGSSQHAIFIFLDFFRLGGPFPCIDGAWTGTGRPGDPQTNPPRGPCRRPFRGLEARFLGVCAGIFPNRAASPPHLPDYLAALLRPSPGGPGSFPGGAEAGGRPAPPPTGGKRRRLALTARVAAFGPRSSGNPNPPMPPPVRRGGPKSMHKTVSVRGSGPRLPSCLPRSHGVAAARPSAEHAQRHRPKPRRTATQDQRRRASLHRPVWASPTPGQPAGSGHEPIQTPKKTVAQAPPALSLGHA